MGKKKVRSSMNSFREIDIDPEPETYLSRDFDLRKLMRRASAAITENDSTTLMDRFRAVLGDWFHGSHPTPDTSSAIDTNWMTKLQNK